MKYPIRVYQAIAIFSFTILSVVQVFLVYNTYQLENERYYFSEKRSINEAYIKWVTNDKVFPGGQAIIDSTIARNAEKLEWLYEHDPEMLEIAKQKICDTIFTTLRKNNSFDKFLSDFTLAAAMDDSLVYCLAIEALEYMMTNGRYLTLYNRNVKYSLLSPELQYPEGIRIGGNLQKPELQNRAAWLSVSEPVPRTNRIIFSLYVDNHNRTLSIVKKMMPVLLLSLISLLINVYLFYITFKNWIKQKKLTEMKTDFLNSITHEFNTPIAAINVASKGLKNQKISGKVENIISLTDVIQRQAARLEKLVGQVLDVTTLHQVTLHKDTYSLHSLLDEILLDYRLNISNQEVDLILLKEANEDRVELDRFHFTTMLLNILDNAIKYNTQPVKKISVSTANYKKGIQLSIRDNGIGMEANTKKQIFKKFYRNESNEMHVTGLGLGLFYVKQCVDAHGWDLFVGSTPGEGTTFIISISQ